VSGSVLLREVLDSDLPVFFEQQKDSESNEMAGLATRESQAFDEHWEKIRADGTIYLRAVIYRELVAGHVVSWKVQGKWFVGYWIGRELWGRGLASKGLKCFLGVVGERPLHARVSFDNTGSMRVLEKNGFVMLPADEQDPYVRTFVLH
jgi:RimJ/RimL family protein N-acetyltransferase